MTRLELWPEERAALRPPSRLSVSEWCDRHLILDAKTNAEPGPFRTARTPYVREIQDTWQDPTVSRVTICAAAQVCKSRVLLNTLAWAVHEDPGPVLLVQPKDEDVVSFNANRVEPLFRESPALAELLTDRKQDWKGAEVHLKTAVIYFASAASPSDLASRSCRYVYFDEADKAPRFSGTESAPLSLAAERLGTFWNAKMLTTSTPTVRGGVVWTEFLRGDQREFWLPCVHCGAWQVLEWKNVRWPEGVTASEVEANGLACYWCPSCGGQITDRAKLDMLARGRWVPKGASIDRDGTVQGAARVAHRSYHLSKLYSPWARWSAMAAEWMRAQGDRAALMGFVNSTLAEPWDETTRTVASDDVERSVVGYERDTVHPDAVCITAGVDVQSDHLVYVVRAWGKLEESWLIRAGKVPGFEALELVLITAAYGSHQVRLIAVDSGYRTDEVYEWTRRWADRARPVKGQTNPSPLPYFPTKIDRHPVTGATFLGGLQLWNVNGGFYKDKIARALAVDSGPGKFHLYARAPAEYRRQLASEQKVVELRGRRGQSEVWVLKPGHRANHYLDAEVYAWAAAHMLGVHLLGGRPPAPRAEVSKRDRQAGGFAGQFRTGRPGAGSATGWRARR